jgi:hypothetical protein
MLYPQPITVAARSEAWTVFAQSNTGILWSSPTRGMDICVRLLCVYVVLCVDSSIATGWSPVQGVLQTVYKLRNWKSGQGPNGCRIMESDVLMFIQPFADLVLLGGRGRKRASRASFCRDVSSGSPARPFDRGSVKVKMFGWLEEVAWYKGRGAFMFLINIELYNLEK